MATDKLINQTQGDDIIDALSDIADNVGNITYGPQTSADKVVSMLGYAEAAEAASINPGDTLNQAIGKLEKKADDNAAEIENKIDKLTTATAGDIATITATGEIADSEVAIETTLSDSSDAKVPTSKAVGTYVADKGYAVGVTSSTANNLVAFNDANGKALKDSGIAVDKSSTGLTDSDTAVPTSKTVKTYVDSTATGISRYLGTITAASGLSTSAKKGDFYVVKTAWTGVHAGDEIIAEKDNPAQTIDGTNWSLLHNEADTDTKYTFATGTTNGTFKVTPSDTGTAQSVAIKGLGNAAYKGVADTVSTSTDLVTSAAVNTKLASYVPNSDFVVAENNISYVSDQISKNQLDTSLDALKAINTAGTWNGNVCTYSVGSVTVNSDGTLTVKKTSTASRLLFYLTENSGSSTPTSGTKYAGCVLSGCPSGGSENTYSQYGEQAQSPWGAVVAEYGNGSTIVTSSLPVYFYIVLNEAYTTPSEGLVFKPMICTAEAWGISHEFEQYALPNHELTLLEAEDRAALAEDIDSGAKNKFNTANIAELRNLATNGSDYAYVSTSTDTRTQCNFCVFSWNGSTKIDQLTKVDVTANGKIALTFTKTASYNKISFGHSGSVKDLMIFLNVSDLVNGQTYVLSVNITQFNPSVTNFAFSDVILCTKAAFGVSSKFVPYRPNYDFVCSGRVAPRTSATLTSGNLNDFPTSYYLCTGAVANLPEYTGYAIVKTIVIDENAALQEAFTLNSSGNKSYMRTKWAGTWNPWVLNTNASS